MGHLRPPFTKGFRVTYTPTLNAFQEGILVSYKSITRERVYVTVDPLMMGACSKGHRAVTLNDANMGHLAHTLSEEINNYIEPNTRLRNELHCHLTLLQGRGYM